MIIIDNSVYEIYSEHNLKKAKLVKFDLGSYNNNPKVIINNVEIKDTNNNKISYPIEKIGDYAFANCINIQEIKLNPNISEIGEGAFQNCISLKSIILPQKLKEIRKCTFYNCNNLNKIVIDSHLAITEIATSAFENCHALKEIDFSCEKKVYIPQTVKTIGDRAFANCNSIKEVYFLPNSSHQTINIGKEAFINCKKIKTINGFERVTTVNQSTFENCMRLQNIETKHIQNIKNNSFKNCQRLRKKGVDLSSVTSFSQSAFSDCNYFPFKNTIESSISNPTYKFPNSFTNKELDIIKFDALWSSKDLEQKNKVCSIVFLTILIMISILIFVTFFLRNLIPQYMIIIGILLLTLGCGIFVFDILSVNYKTTYVKLFSFYKALGLSFFSVGFLIFLNGINHTKNDIILTLEIIPVFLYVFSIFIMLIAGIRTVYFTVKHSKIIPKIERIPILKLTLTFLTVLIFFTDAKTSIIDFARFISKLLKILFG